MPSPGSPPGRTHIRPNHLNLVHIDASDLQRARVVRARLLDEARRRGSGTEAIAASLTVQVLIDEKYSNARRAYAELCHEIDENVLTYVGTVSGLQSLISDAYVAEAADAFVIKPLRWAPTVNLVANEVVPALGADGQARPLLTATEVTAARRPGSPRHSSNATRRPASFAVLTADRMTPDWFEARDWSCGQVSRTPFGEYHPVTA